MSFTNGDTSIFKNKKLFIFDMDGTIYLGNSPFDFAIKFIKNLHDSGRRVLYFTNNASHTTDFYMKKLARLGFDPREGEIMTSGDVTIEFLKRHRAGKSVYLVGTDELLENFKASGINILSGKEDRADIVVTSFDTSLTYEKLDNACRFIRGGAEYLSTHPDKNCPTETGFIPDSGAISAFVTTSTDVVPTYFGKPYKETIEMISEATGVDPADMCIFGDRLMTDIALGVRFGVTASLVLSGESQLVDVEAAADKDKPNFVFNSLADVDKIIFG
jgi:HAD superfamily hydrolase (TIGR01450 family)